MVRGQHKHKDIDLLGVILAGGCSSRMGGRDKALARLAGETLIAHAVRRLAPQVDAVVIAGPQDFGTGLTSVPDKGPGVEGPTAGIAAVAAWSLEHRPGVVGLLTVPVDCPFFPSDLARQLATNSDRAAIARGDGRMQPAFGYWPVAAIAGHTDLFAQDGWLSLRRLAAACDAAEVEFGDGGAFHNINTVDDLAAAEARLAASGEGFAHERAL